MLNQQIKPEYFNQSAQEFLPQYLGIEITEIGEDFVTGKMPVQKRHQQPYGILHGGASVVLAETLGSIAGWLAVDITQYHCVGLDINANHIRAVRDGFVYGKATPIHIGKTTQVWEIRITNDEDKLVCISRLTLAVLPLSPKKS